MKKTGKVVKADYSPRITWRRGRWYLIPVGAYMYEDWTLSSDDLTELVDLCHGRRQLEIVR